MVCFTPRPAASYRNTRAYSTACHPSFVAPRSSSADDGGGAPGSRDTASSSSMRCAYASSVSGLNSSMPYSWRHDSASAAGSRWYRPLLISVLPPTQRPSANAMAGFPSAAASPRCRYLAAISSSENGSSASGSIHGPSSTTVTSRPEAASVAAVAAPPAPEPITSTSASIVASGVVIGPRRASARARRTAPDNGAVARTGRPDQLASPSLL